MKSIAVSRNIAVFLGVAVLVYGSASAETFFSPDGNVATFAFRGPAKKLDVSKAAPMRLPLVSRPLPSLVDLTIEAAKYRAPGPGRVFLGGRGDEKPAASAVADAGAMEAQAASASDGVGSQDYGTSGQPYTMARIPSPNLGPYRQAGKLFFNPPTGFAILSCTAALIKPGVLVTAAHCIVPYGSTAKNLNFTYFPAWDPSTTYPSWDAASASVLSSWTAGTSPCTTRGTVCRDDIGVITLQPKQDSGGHNTYPGAQFGWFGYSLNTYYYANGQAEISQLGYTAGFDSGNIMLRTDSQGSISSSNANNTIIGSPLGDGSDGGPWVVNLGDRPIMSNGSFGSANGHNILVGVTSWATGTSATQKQAGASPFLANNLGTLVNTACSATPAAC